MYRVLHNGIIHPQIEIYMVCAIYLADAVGLSVNELLARKAK